ncbi:MAG: hypothetical protein JWP36_2509 [Paucimonas sp.]|nr:hypothetical protein [Paucimonas sp.]
MTAFSTGGASLDDRSRHNRQDFAATLRLVLGGFWALALVTVLIYGVISWQEQKRALTHSIIQQSRYLAGLSEDFLSGVAYGIDAIARTVGPARSVEHAQAMWDTLRASHPEIDSLLLTDRLGKESFNSAGIRDDRSQRLLSDLFEMESRGGARFYLGVPRFDQNYDNPEVGISHVSHDERGHPVWRVEAKVKLAQLTRRWQTELLPEGAQVLLMHANGYVIAEGGRSAPGFFDSFPGLVQALQAETAIEGDFQTGDPAIIIAFQRLQRQHATILILLPESAVWRRWIENNSVAFIAFGVSLVVYFFLALLLLRRERLHSWRLLEQADTDALTGIPNRAAAERHLSLEVARARREHASLGVIYIDLDEFKGVNDNYGHQSGDKLLVQLTARLSAVLRAGDMLARLGGDEYLAVVNCRSGDELVAVCNRLLDSMREPITVNDRQHRLTLSIGASYYPQDGANAEELLKKADIAMYAAKGAGRNGCRLFNSTMADEALAKAEMKAQLELALARDEFVLLYQPRFNSGRQAIGAETLIRWQHPERGLLSPELFIRYAEECGLIVPIGRMVLERACRQALAWQASGRRLSVSINVSVKELEAKDFAAEALRIVAATGVDPALIQIEVTESMLSSNPDAVLACLEQLTDAGLSIELDDFGTGYSSLSYLRRFPISTIKIDQSFVHDIQTVPESRSLIIAIIAMANALDCAVVAEGVENEAEFYFLQSCGCRQFQGYYLAHPQTAHEIDRNALAAPAPASMLLQEAGPG